MRRILIMIVILLIIFIALYISNTNVRDFSVLKKTTATKLMIVAHPDDEIMWGSEQLLRDDYLVVCITCGKNYLRRQEYKSVMNYTKDDYIMLQYPDKVRNKRSDWKKQKKEIVADLEKIINSKDWELIVTHNPEGEYGHIQHIMTNKLVTALADKNKLFYFGKYYRKKNITDDMKKISDCKLTEKKYIIENLYKTQTKILNGMNQMYPYENWISYHEWEENHE